MEKRKRAASLEKLRFTLSLRPVKLRLALRSHKGRSTGRNSNGSRQGPAPGTGRGGVTFPTAFNWLFGLCPDTFKTVVNVQAKQGRKYAYPLSNVSSFILNSTRERHAD